MKRRERSSFPTGDERGQAVVEFSAVLLLIVILVFGIIEMGRMALIYISLADGARAGLRYAMVHGANSSSPSTYNSFGSVKTQVWNITSLAGLSGASVTVTPTYANNTGGTGSDPNGNLTGDTVKVQASYSYLPIIGLPPFSSLNLTLSSTSQGNICY